MDDTGSVTTLATALLDEGDLGAGARLAAVVGSQRANAELLASVAEVVRRRSAPIVVPPRRVVSDITYVPAASTGDIDVSGASAILTAAADGTVALHAPPCGALLDALHIPTSLVSDAAEESLDQTGFAVLAAPLFSPALQRLEASVPTARTFLDLLAPLAHPANPDVVLVGVSDPALTEPLARALGLLGASAALVVCSRGAPLLRADADARGHLWRRGRISVFRHAAAAAPIDASSRGLAGDARRIEALLKGGDDPLAEHVALNAGVALWLADHLPRLDDGVAWARDRLRQGIDLTPFRWPCGEA